jgi:hypothetical protein
MENEDMRNFVIQGVLLAFYLALTVLFSLRRSTWPLSIYYAGCLVKDAGVFILGWALAGRS